jgi:hypothetical protein
VPVDQTMSGQAPDGTHMVFHDFISHPGRRYAFEVGYFDLGTGVALPDAHAALAGMVDAMAAELDGEVTSSTPATLRGEDAEEFTVEYSDNGRAATAIGRVAMRGNRLYLVAVTAPGLQRAAFDRFVASFEFSGGEAG